MTANSVNSTSQRGWLLRLAQSFYWAILKFIALFDNSKRPGQAFLAGNFAPVHDERLDSYLAVLGSLPPELDGAFLRIGPNPDQPIIAGYHWFDGDGMCHSTRLMPVEGRATYSNHQVVTSRLQQERQAGWPLTPKFGDYTGVRGLAVVLLDVVARKLGLLDDSRGLGAANTALTVHARRLLALHEGDLPHSLHLGADGGAWRTLGRLVFDGKLRHPFTAHPKLDPHSKELFFFGYSIHNAPYCWLSRLDAEGRLVADFPVPLARPVMMHDFALTTKHVIVIDVPLVFDPKVMVKEGTLPFVHDKRRPARFGVLPRSAMSSAGIRWFDAEPFTAFHVANAWEEDGRINIFLCTFEDFSLSLEENPKVRRELPKLTLVVLDLESGATTVRRVADLACDFPQVPPALVGRKTRYAYVSTMETTPLNQPVFNGVAKMDLQAADPAGAIAGRVLYGAGRYGGEAQFVPSGVAGAAEDDGYLVTYVHDEREDSSELAVFDAKSMSSAPLARVPLKRRVPYGFHSLWVPAAQLQVLRQEL